MNRFIRGGGGTPNGGTAVLEGGVRTLEDTMISLTFRIISCPNTRICADSGEDGRSIPNFFIFLVP